MRTCIYINRKISKNLKNRNILIAISRNLLQLSFWKRYVKDFSSNKQTPFCFNPDGCLHEMKENVAKISFFKHLFRRSEHFRYSMQFNQGRFCEKYKTFNDFHDWSLLIQPKSVSINNIPKKTIDIALICIFKCEFCKKLLLYECNSDQLPTFFILSSLLGGCNSKVTANPLTQK